MSARARRLKVVSKQEPRPELAWGEPAWGDAAREINGAALLLENMITGCQQAEPPDADRDQALFEIAQLMRQIAEHGRVV